MKGIVFTEFIELVEDMFSPEIADAIIEESDLASGGSYTSVLSYDHNEMITLVALLSQKTKIPVKDLLKTYGERLCGRFSVLYPDFFTGASSTLDFLETVENHIHVEVRKLYADAEVPSFQTERKSNKIMHMLYRSTRPFADLAEGLIIGTAHHFGETLELEREDWKDGDFHCARFSLTCRNE